MYISLRVKLPIILCERLCYTQEPFISIVINMLSKSLVSVVTWVTCKSNSVLQSFHLWAFSWVYLFLIIPRCFLQFESNSFLKPNLVAHLLEIFVLDTICHKECIRNIPLFRSLQSITLKWILLKYITYTVHFSQFLLVQLVFLSSYISRIALMQLREKRGTSTTQQIQFSHI